MLHFDEYNADRDAFSQVSQLAVRVHASVHSLFAWKMCHTLFTHSSSTLLSLPRVSCRRRRRRLFRIYNAECVWVFAFL